MSTHHAVRSMPVHKHVQISEMSIPATQTVPGAAIVLSILISKMAIVFHLRNAGLYSLLYIYVYY